MAGYGAPSAIPAGSSNSFVGAQGLKAACEAGRPGKDGRKPVFGSWMMFHGAGLARVIATNFGFKWILVDMEHGSIGDSEMHAMIPSIAGAGVSPIVRVPAPENTFVKRALDAGAHGLMFPMIETKEQAQAVVRMCKFPPTGIRGVGSPFAPALFGKTVTGYQDIANDATMVIVQIETVLGIKNAAEIASVPGIDMLFIGPNDLACSMGNGSKNHMDVPEAQEAIEQIRQAAENSGKLAGIWCTTAEQAGARFKQGFQLINVGADVVAIGTWMSSELAKANELAME